MRILGPGKGGINPDFFRALIFINKIEGASPGNSKMTALRPPIYKKGPLRRASPFLLVR